MKTLLTLALVASLGGGILFASASQSQEEQAAVSETNGIEAKPTNQHENGVVSNALVRLSDGLMTNEDGDTLRVMSFTVQFIGTGRVSLSTLHGLEELEASTSDMVQVDIAGISPDLMATNPIIPPQGYTVSLYPKQGMTWADVTENDVEVVVVRSR